MHQQICPIENEAKVLKLILINIAIMALFVNNLEANIKLVNI